ncbi:ABC transporter permease [Bordetella trematum]|uniref:ABC transporter permease n=1 Tax=Bordetella trematum TaxID=123899 RepID=UPI001405173C|nr:ABC transporter permease [Bordetella trematum]QIM70239.1 sugar ABC transporter permease [Bordetella trematum]
MQKRASLKITRAVIFALVLREFRGRLNAKRLGSFWILFEPVAHVLGMIAIITVIRGRAIPGFDVPVFLLTGIVPFLLMKNICLKSMEAVASNKALFAYRQIKPFDTLVARAIVEFVLAACVYTVLMFGVGFFVQMDISMTDPLRWLGVLAVGVLFSFSLGVILCVVGEAVPELKVFFRMMFLPLYFLSGVVYPLWIMPSHILEYVAWNPFLHIIDGLRKGIFENYPITQGVGMTFPIAITFVTMFVAMGLYRARRFRLVAV